MNRKLFCVVILVALAPPLLAQRYMDRAGRASFYSKAPLEDIEAHTDQALCILDAASGEVAASMLMKSFQFEKALMQEHFNEKYVESDKYPKATFTGKIANLSDIDLSQDGAYTARVEGEVTIHGVTRPLTTDVEFVVADGTIRATGSFPLRVKDFKITIPTLVVRNIAEVIEVRIAFDLRPAG
ncbi:MAG TPA: YceI family protein [Cyclobacteriaceae bacterium]|nr:YceI family protein [Cyclobacteriaceae bacterium]